MSQVVQDFRQTAPGPFAKRQRWRELMLYSLLFILLLCVAGLGAVLIRTIKEDAEAMPVDQIIRSTSEMVNGGKRFIDGFYSMNAATVEHDQFRAINMMSSDEQKRERIKYLTENDYVRKVRDSRWSSSIRWDQAEWKVIDTKDGVMRVEYQTQFVLNNKDSYPIDMVLSLTPTEKTDTNTDGVAVVAWVDVADTPFTEGAE